MKIIKKPLVPPYDRENADWDDLGKYIRRIAYWVGYFIIEFNSLEARITDSIAERIDGQLETNEYAYIFLSAMSFDQRINLWQRYYQYMIPMWFGYPEKCEHLQKRVDVLITQLKDLASTRNAIVHADYYSLDQEGNVVSKIKFERGSVEQHLMPITKEFLVGNINLAIQLRESISDFEEDIGW